MKSWNNGCGTAPGNLVRTHITDNQYTATVDHSFNWPIEIIHVYFEMKLKKALLSAIPHHLPRSYWAEIKLLNRYILLIGLMT